MGEGVKAKERDSSAKAFPKKGAVGSEAGESIEGPPLASFGSSWKGYWDLVGLTGVALLIRENPAIDQTLKLDGPSHNG